jgi:hypothetical protein
MAMIHETVAVSRGLGTRKEGSQEISGENDAILNKLYPDLGMENQLTRGATAAFQSARAR